MADDFEEEPVPTYQEFLDAKAKELQADPFMLLFRGVVEYVRHLQTRELLIINALRAKDIISDYEIEEFFGLEAHKAAQAEGLKSITKHFCRLAAEEKLESPFSDKRIRPDEVLVIINDILDLNGTGWDGRTVETICEMRGQGENLRKVYELEIAEIKKRNESKTLARERAEKLRELRAHRLRIYLSKCNVDNKPHPSKEDQEKMLIGEMPIPEAP